MLSRQAKEGHETVDSRSEARQSAAWGPSGPLRTDVELRRAV